MSINLGLELASYENYLHGILTGQAWAHFCAHTQNCMHATACGFANTWQQKFRL